MHPKDRRKTPEELAAIAAEMKRQKQISADKEAIRRVKNGQIIIFVLAGIMILSSVLEYYKFNEMIEVFYIYAPFVIAFVVLGIVYNRNPYVVSIAALCIYSALILVSIAGDPANLVNGIIIKIIIISGLVRAIKYGKDYQVAVKRKDTGLLDDELTV